MMKWSLRHFIGERFSRVKHVFYTQEEMDSFWKNPVWLAMQRQIAVDISEWIDTLQQFGIAHDNEVAARASIAALERVFGRKYWENYIVREIDAEGLRVRSAIGKALAELDSVMRDMS